MKTPPQKESSTLWWNHLHAIDLFGIINLDFKTNRRLFHFDRSNPTESRAHDFTHLFSAYILNTWSQVCWNGRIKLNEKQQWAHAGLHNTVSMSAMPSIFQRNILLYFILCVRDLRLRKFQSVAAFFLSNFTVKKYTQHHVLVHWNWVCDDCKHEPARSCE